MIKNEKQEFISNRTQSQLLNQTQFLKEEEEDPLDISITMQIKRKGHVNRGRSRGRVRGRVRGGRGRQRGGGEKRKQKNSYSQPRNHQKGVKQEALFNSFSNSDIQNQPTQDQLEQPQKIIGMRYNKKTYQNEYLIKWVGYGESESTWESIENLEGCKVLISFYLLEISRQLPILDPLFSIPPMPNVEPIAIISIKDGYCWLSWPFRDNYEKPDITRVREGCAKKYFPQLYEERIKYEQSIKNGYKKVDQKILSTWDHYDDQAICVYDIRKGLCLIKLGIKDKLQLVWCDMKLVNPIMVLEYFSVQNWIYKF